MKILYINNDGGGFADHVDGAVGTTVQAFFAERVTHGSPHDYLIRVNRQPTTADQVLQEGDRVSFTPTKIEGASRQRCGQLHTALRSNPASSTTASDAG